MPQTDPAKLPLPTVDCVIVGAGPAGLTAALYLCRFHRRVLVLHHGDARVQRIAWSHNVPGFPGGIGGTELLQRLRTQLAEVQPAGHCEVVQAEVTALERHAAGGFRVHAGPRHWHTHTVVLATGAVDLEPAVPGAARLRERGLLRQCPICDGHEHSGRAIVVVGAGDHAAREALFLRHYSDRITIATSAGGDAAPSPQMQTRLNDCGVARLPGRLAALDCTPDGVVVSMDDGNAHAFDTLYAALGCHPRADLAVRLGAGRDHLGNLIIDDHCRTDVAGLYAAGDVTGGLDQISVAMGQAAIAATAIHNTL